MFTIKTGKSEFGAHAINKVNSIDEIRTVLSEIYSRTDDKSSVYNWDDDGECAVLDAYENEREDNCEKMIQRVVERVEKFGWCSFFGGNTHISIINE